MSKSDEYETTGALLGTLGMMNRDGLLGGNSTQSILEAASRGAKGKTESQQKYFTSAIKSAGDNCATNKEDDGSKTQ